VATDNRHSFEYLHLSSLIKRKSLVKSEGRRQFRPIWHHSASVDALVLYSAPIF